MSEDELKTIYAEAVADGKESHWAVNPRCFSDLSSMAMFYPQLVNKELGGKRVVGSYLGLDVVVSREIDGIALVTKPRLPVVAETAT